uniref:Transmembrane protein 47 n=1 Tax=Eptatretus burgeri TaxID=7764 RepID=A0A8C4WXE9_EPTBU
MCMEASKMETGVSVAVRPFKAIALLCAFLAVSLASVAVFSPAWVTAQGFKLSLWEECEGSASREGAQPVWGCKSNLSLHNDWKLATLALVLAACLLSLLATITGLVALCAGSYRRLSLPMAVLLYMAVILQVCALILFPIKFLDETALRSYHEFDWGYGLAWGAAIFMLGSAILLSLTKKCNYYGV